MVRAGGEPGLLVLVEYRPAPEDALRRVEGALVDVTFTDEAGRATNAQATTDGDGLVPFPDLRGLGVIDVTVSKPKLDSMRKRFRVDTRRGAVRIELRPTAYSGRGISFVVKDPAGKPIPGVEVTWEHSPPAITDDQGRVRFRKVQGPPFTGRVTAGGAGWRGVCHDLSGVTARTTVLRMKPARSTLSDETGTDEATLGSDGSVISDTIARRPPGPPVPRVVPGGRPEKPDEEPLPEDEPPSRSGSLPPGNRSITPMSPPAAWTLRSRSATTVTRDPPVGSISRGSPPRAGSARPSRNGAIPVTSRRTSSGMPGKTSISNGSRSKGLTR